MGFDIPDGGTPDRPQQRAIHPRHSGSGRKDETPRAILGRSGRARLFEEGAGSIGGTNRRDVWRPVCHRVVAQGPLL